MKKLIALIVGVLVVVSALAAGIGTGGSGVGGFPASPRFTGVTVTGTSTLGVMNASGASRVGGIDPFNAQFTVRLDGASAREFGIYNNSSAYAETLAYWQTETAPGTGWNFLTLRAAGGSEQVGIRGDGRIAANSLGFFTAASQIVPGATSISLRNNANNADNLLITDAGLVTVRNTVASTKACATGFTRVMPNYCRSTTLLTFAWADATACTARATGLGLPADAKLVNLQIQWRALSNNAIGLRTNNILF